MESLSADGLVGGLSLIRDFITTEEEESIIKMIDNNPWLSDIKRRVQHYGYKFS